MSAFTIECCIDCGYHRVIGEKGPCPECGETVFTTGESDPVNHPSHYTSKGVECITVTEQFSFLRGNIIKYVWRAGEKGGKDKEIEDLKKARWYLDREIARLEK